MILPLPITQHIRFALALRDIVPFGRNVVYARNVIRNHGGNVFGGAQISKLKEG